MVMESITIITPTGCIGNRGIDREALAAAVAAEAPHAIAVDAGSIDCGPWYLGAGREHSPIAHIEWDIEVILDCAIPNGIPVIIGSAGGSGARAHVDRTVEIVRRIAAAKGHRFRLAVIYADVDPDFLLEREQDGVIAGSAQITDQTPLSADAVRASDVIVGMMGVGPIIEALEAGADVIVAGRTVDAAVIAALPISKGFDKGLSYHMGDIMECAESCAIEIEPTLRALGRNRIPIIGRIVGNAFFLKPAVTTLACTPESCLMHSAYERTDMDTIKVPEGRVDRATALYEAEDRNTTRISGSRFIDEPHSILFEGVRKVGYRSIFPFAVRTPQMISQLDEILANVDEIERGLFSSAGNFHIHWHRYGQDAVLGAAEPETSPYEVGLLADVVADSQELAHDVAYDLFTRIGFWRYPGRYTTAGNIAVTLSPAVFDGGPVYEFSIYHAVQIDESEPLFKVEIMEVSE
jgi:hypothetical protein